MAPEILMTEPHDERVDIWAVGILLYELFHNKEPYSGNSPKEILGKIMSGLPNYESQMTSEARNLYEEIVGIDKKQRPTFEQILSHPFLSNSVPRLSTSRKTKKIKRAASSAISRANRLDKEYVQITKRQNSQVSDKRSIIVPSAQNPQNTSLSAAITSNGFKLSPNLPFERLSSRPHPEKELNFLANEIKRKGISLNNFVSPQVKNALISPVIESQPASAINRIARMRRYNLSGVIKPAEAPSSRDNSQGRVFTKPLFFEGKSSSGKKPKYRSLHPDKKNASYHQATSREASTNLNVVEVERDTYNWNPSLRGSEDISQVKRVQEYLKEDPRNSNGQGMIIKPTTSVLQKPVFRKKENNESLQPKMPVSSSMNYATIYNNKYVEGNNPQNAIIPSPWPMAHHRIDGGLKKESPRYCSQNRNIAFSGRQNQSNGFQGVFGTSFYSRNPQSRIGDTINTETVLNRFRGVSHSTSINPVQRKVAPTGIKRLQLTSERPSEDVPQNNIQGSSRRFIGRSVQVGVERS